MAISLCVSPYVFSSPFFVSLIEAFSPFTFRVIDGYVLIAICCFLVVFVLYHFFLIYWFCFDWFLSLHFLYFWFMVTMWLIYFHLYLTVYFKLIGIKVQSHSKSSTFLLPSPLFLLYLFVLCNSIIYCPDSYFCYYCLLTFLLAL